jgi:hypothetical protein
MGEKQLGWVCSTFQCLGIRCQGRMIRRCLSRCNHKHKKGATNRPSFRNAGNRHCYIRYFLPKSARPSNPVPRRSRDEGSGTGVTRTTRFCNRHHPNLDSLRPPRTYHPPPRREQNAYLLSCTGNTLHPVISWVIYSPFRAI